MMSLRRFLISAPRSTLFGITVLCALGLLFNQTASAQTVTFVAPSAEGSYDEATGEGSFSIDITATITGGTVDSEGYSFSLGFDGDLVEATGILTTAALDALNGGTGPAFFSANLTTGGAALNVIHDDTPPEDPVEWDTSVVLGTIEFSTESSALLDDDDGASVSLTWDDTINYEGATVDQAYTVGGIEETPELTDGNIDLVPDLCDVIPNTLLVPDDYETIQDAIDDAEECDEIIVSAGVYLETIDFMGKNISVIADEGAEATVISGSGVGPVVTFDSGESRACVLDGFTVTAGLSDGLHGGGIHIFGAGPEVRNCIITGNITTGEVASAGGGVYIAESNAYIHDNLISRNDATGGVAVGGGIYVESVSCPSDESCSNTPVIEWNIVQSNRALADPDGIISLGIGGGMMISTGSAPIVRKNVFAFNFASNRGGGLNVGSEVTLDGNTIYENDADESEGGIGAGNGDILNCIVWGNTAPDDPQLNTSEWDSITYSDIDGGATGTGNIDEEPQLVSPDTLDFTLDEDSPCIDAGDPDSPLDDDDSIVDMGAGLAIEISFVEFRRGDVDGDGVTFPIVDALWLLDYGFLSGPAPPCLAAADVDGTGDVFPIVDALYLLEWGFINGPEPPAPGPYDCGIDTNVLVDCIIPPDCT